MLDDGLGDAKISALRKSADLLMDLESHELGDIIVCKVPSDGPALGAGGGDVTDGIFALVILLVEKLWSWS